MLGKPLFPRPQHKCFNVKGGFLNYFFLVGGQGLMYPRLALPSCLWLQIMGLQACTTVVYALQGCPS